MITPLILAVNHKGKEVSKTNFNLYSLPLPRSLIHQGCLYFENTRKSRNVSNKLHFFSPQIKIWCQIATTNIYRGHLGVTASVGRHSVLAVTFSNKCNKTRSLFTFDSEGKGIMGHALQLS